MEFALLFFDARPVSLVILEVREPRRLQKFYRGDCRSAKQLDDENFCESKFRKFLTPYQASVCTERIFIENKYLLRSTKKCVCSYLNNDFVDSTKSFSQLSNYFTAAKI